MGMKYSMEVINKRFNKLVKTRKWTLPIVLVLYNFILLVDKDFREDLNSNVKKYKAAGIKASKWNLKQAMLKAYLSDYFRPYEFRCFDFWDKTPDQRHAYLSDEDVWDYFSRNKEINLLPRNKFKRYQSFASLFKRDIVNLQLDGGVEDKLRYDSFSKRHAEAICKPNAGTRGQGIVKLMLSQLSYEQVKDMIGGECMLEEVIFQGDELGCFHPQSINTIRLVTGLSPDGKFSFLYALFRTGCGDSVVDNVGAGGLICLVNFDGVVETDAMRKGEYFAEHPDTKVRFKGARIPAWKDLLKIAEDAHRTMTKQRLFGWDFAWTPNGWDLVEVNPAPASASYQTLAQRGVRPILEKAGIL